MFNVDGEIEPFGPAVGVIVNVLETAMTIRPNISDVGELGTKVSTHPFVSQSRNIIENPTTSPGFRLKSWRTSPLFNGWLIS